MAYNFFPAGYQPYQVQSNAQNSLIWVTGEVGAKSYPVAPNSSVALWDSEANVVYIKSADASGMPSVKVLDYTVRTDSPKTAEIQPQSDFVTHGELSAIREEIDAIKAKFDEPKKEKKDGK